MDQPAPRAFVAATLQLDAIKARVRAAKAFSAAVEQRNAQRLQAKHSSRRAAASPVATTMVQVSTGVAAQHSAYTWGLAPPALPVQHPVAKQPRVERHVPAHGDGSSSRQPAAAAPAAVGAAAAVCAAAGSHVRCRRARGVGASRGPTLQLLSRAPPPPPRAAPAPAAVAAAAASDSEAGAAAAAAPASDAACQPPARPCCSEPAEQEDPAAALPSSPSAAPAGPRLLTEVSSTGAAGLPDAPADSGQQPARPAATELAHAPVPVATTAGAPQHGRGGVDGSSRLLAFSSARRQGTSSPTAAQPAAAQHHVPQAASPPARRGAAGHAAASGAPHWSPVRPVSGQPRVVRPM
jgi:hypothetical protein